MNDENENNLKQGMGAAPDEADDSVTLETGRPAVASAPGKILVFVIAGVIFVAIVVKALFFSGGGPVVENKAKKRPESVTAASQTKASGISPGELPVPPQQDPLATYSSQSNTGFSNSNGGGPDLSKLPPPPTPPSGGGSGAPTISMPGVPSLGGGGSGGSPSLITPTAPVFAMPSVPAIPSISPTAPTTTGGAGGAGSSALPPPPPPPGITPPAVPEVKTSLPKDEKAMKKIQSEMVSYGGSAGAANPKAAPKAKTPTTGFTGNDANSQFANSAVAAAKESAIAERIENLDYTLVQGKIVHAVLETAIDSDLPGTLRAIVGHDVYAEAGRAILIPKGSRLIGTYNAAVKRGQARVFIIWTRLIRPDGITIDIDSPAIDSLGRAGLDGEVDNKYTEMFSTALLTSAMDIGIAAVGEALFGDEQSTTTTNGGGSTTTTSATGTAMQGAVDNVGQVGKTIVGATLTLTPTITVDQGTPVNVFVNKELVFPPSVTGNMMGFIQ